ncbi:MAG: 16S rRNA (adenine(1518)-N(6)/adenine(1519)-N(6))-dimethyltransferase RsmA [Phycisphaerales bacterium]|jgi:16S rRNA (adenine1518-N6/adenine1519-N6)-dimethyltransferase
MQTLSEIKAMLAGAGLSPRKALGQNFLVDHNLIRKLVDASGVMAGETVLEVGPGTGTMTEELLDRGCRVVASELDGGLAAMLRARFAPRGDAFRLVEGDCLAGKHALNPEVLQAVGGGPFVLVSNLPYGAATPVMNILLAEMPACRGLFVTIQLEVAQRLMARPSTRDYGSISILAQATAELELIAKAPPECFWPRPDVHSAMLAARRLAVPRCETPGVMAKWCQTLFEKRRKQLGAVLGRGLAWPEGIRPEQRAEELDLDQLIALWRVVREAASA